MCFDYVERYAMLLNELNDSIKLPPGEYPPDDCLGIFSPIKIPTMSIAPWENHPCKNSSGENCFATCIKTGNL